jgi:hypothetical protein
MAFVGEVSLVSKASAPATGPDAFGTGVVTAPTRCKNRDFCSTVSIFSVRFDLDPKNSSRDIAAGAFFAAVVLEAAVVGRAD